MFFLLDWLNVIFNLFLLNYNLRVLFIFISPMLIRKAAKVQWKLFNFSNEEIRRNEEGISV
jgi:hypothetical protein